MLRLFAMIMMLALPVLSVIESPSVKEVSCWVPESVL